MILPNIGSNRTYASRRVTKLLGLSGRITLDVTARTTRTALDTTPSGIIPFTFTA